MLSVSEESAAMRTCEDESFTIVDPVQFLHFLHSLELSPIFSHCYIISPNIIALSIFLSRLTALLEGLGTFFASTPRGSAGLAIPVRILGVLTSDLVGSSVLNIEDFSLSLVFVVSLVLR